MIAPSSVNLNWFSSDEALDLEPHVLIERTYQLLAKALNEIELEYSENDLELCKVGDPSSSLRFLHFLKRSYEQSVDRKIAPSAEMMTMTDLYEFKKETENMMVSEEEPVTESEYTASEVWLMLYALEFFQDLAKMDFNDVSTLFIKRSKGSDRKLGKNNS